MDQQGIEYLVLVHDGTHSFLEPNPIFMLSGFKGAGPCLLLVGKDKTMRLILTPSWDVRRAHGRPDFASVSGYDDFEHACVVLGRTLSVPPAKVGLVGVNSVKRSVSLPLRSIFRGQPRQVDAAFYEIASKKTTGELEYAKKAAEIADRGYERLLELVRPGVSENELASRIDCFMRSEGADDDFLMLSASQHNRAIRPPMGRIIEEGDIILAEISPSFRGQFVQICRTLSVDGGRREIFAKYSLLVSALENGMKAAVPGTTIAEVVEKMNRPLEDAGYGEYCHPPYMRVRGHGLGLSSTLPGDISEDNQNVLEEDMLFVMHPNQYIPETGYMMCGEPVVITTGGARSLSGRSPALDAIGGPWA